MALELAMSRRLIRRIAFCLIALLGFAQGTVALAACVMERGAPMQMDSAGDATCCDEDGGTVGSMPSNACVAHCTADLQIPSVQVVLVRAPANAPILLVARLRQDALIHAVVEVPPPHGIPPRILLHSFLV